MKRSIIFVVLLSVIVMCKSSLDNSVSPSEQEEEGTWSAEDYDHILTIMTYNVLLGAGVDPALAQLASDRSNGQFQGNRLPEILSFVDQIEPDIMGFNEIEGWDDNTMNDVSDSLDLPYHLYYSTNAFFSRYPIISHEFLDGDSLNFRGAIYASTQTPWGDTLHVFVAHLYWVSGDPFKAVEYQYLANNMKPYEDLITFLMGDMNSNAEGIQPLRDAGWVAMRNPVNAVFSMQIDHIWTTSELEERSMVIDVYGEYNVDYLHSLTDHPPLAAKVGFVSN